MDMEKMMPEAKHRMAKKFNVNGYCDPELHYMVDLSGRLKTIKAMVDEGDYFTINRARQYGKTTILAAMADYLKEDYEVVSLDFQTMSSLAFESEEMFVTAFAEELLDAVDSFPDGIESRIGTFAQNTARICSLQALFKVLNHWCAKAARKIILMIDEVDTATNNQVFLDFLAQLRACYLKRRRISTFQSVVLAGVVDVRSIQRKLRPDEDHRDNSPWNIAADFLVDMSFSVEDIAGMLNQYEADYGTGMDTGKMAELIYGYTSGYPYLVSRLCKLLDERISGTEAFPDKPRAWTEAGFYEAEKKLVKEDNPLYQSLIGKLKQYPVLKTLAGELLFNGRTVAYTATADYIKDAAMYGFIRNEDNVAVISNRIFETVLYDYFVAGEQIGSLMYHIGEQEKNQFIVGGHLDMRRVLEKFVETFHELYGKKDDKFREDVGRKYFILFLKPIINGVGNYSIESRTRDNGRMDIVIFYRGERYVLELKLWRGKAYNQRGEEQLSDYLDCFGLKKGYMLSFNFNKKKVIGVKEIVLGDRLLIEAVV